MIYALPKETRVIIGNSLLAQVQIQGYGSDPYCCCLLNYDDERVYLSRVALTPEKRLAEEERFLQRMIESQQGIDGSPENFDTLFAELRGPAVESRVILDSHEMRGHEPHAFNLVETHMLVNNTFYFRVTVPAMDTEGSGGQADEDIDDRAIMAALLEGGGAGNAQ